jgi:hypothetical protein
VSLADRQLVEALRSEIAAVDPGRDCDRRAERAGLWPPAGARRAPPAAHDPVLGRLAHRLGRPEGDPPFDWGSAPDHCRMAFLRGRFLARGSLSLSNGRTHLEFVTPPDEAVTLAGWLADAGMPASWRLRRGRGVVTWKSAETVGVFLRRVGAGAALLELEARQVARAMRGDLNRVLNAESANLGRIVAAAGRQLAAISTLEEEGRLAEQPVLVRRVAEARRATPEATLTDLGDRLAIHRSAVQRALERIERLASDGAGGDGNRPRRRDGNGVRRRRPGLA